MTRRRLRPDELALWQQVARTTERFGKRDYFAPKGAEPAKPVSDTVRKPSDPVPAFKLGEAAGSRPETWSMPQDASTRLRRDKVAMDAKAFSRLKRGKLRPEGRLDLHGMTLDQAHPALVRFILDAQARGKRLVLVITGKGNRADPYDPMPQRRGVLKQQVPQWLRMPPVAGAVLQVSEAHISHGGAGAYYVYLRKGAGR